MTQYTCDVSTAAARCTHASTPHVSSGLVLGERAAVSVSRELCGDIFGLHNYWFLVVLSSFSRLLSEQQQFVWRKQWRHKSTYTLFTTIFDPRTDFDGDVPQLSALFACVTSEIQTRLLWRSSRCQESMELLQSTQVDVGWWRLKKPFSIKIMRIPNSWSRSWKQNSYSTIMIQFNPHTQH